MTTLEQLFNKGYLPRTKQFLQQLAILTKKEYESRILETKPEWWGRMALSNSAGGGGGIGIKQIPGGYIVYYLNQGKYNYLSVIEKGRAPYSIKNALLRSPRVRYGEKGKYIIVPFLKSYGRKVNAQNFDINSILRFAGNLKDQRNITRKKYTLIEIKTGSGNVFGIEQGPIKTGRMQYSYVKYMTVSEESNGWIYPKIKSQPIGPILQKKVNNILNSNQFQDLIKKDVTEFLEKFVR